MKKILLTICSLLLICICFNPIVVKANSNRVVDNASTLTMEEEIYLETYLQNISQELNMDIVILTTFTAEGKSLNLYAADYYDENGYGQDAVNSGAILCLDMDQRYYEVVYTGYAIQYYEGQENKFDDYFLADLKSGNYLKAYENFAQACRYCYADYQQSQDFQPFKSGVIALGLGAVVATIVCLILKSKHKTVRHKYEATNYIKDGSFNLNIANDILLYVSTSRVRRSSDSSKSSSTHFSSSSGVSHSSHGGKF